jgi:DNA-binding XRE family transcriptional regulator
MYSSVYYGGGVGNQSCSSQVVEDKLGRNTVKDIREELLMSKAELARKAGVSPLTIDRVERGKNCRMETKRKIILALGYDLSEKEKIFPGD